VLVILIRWSWTLPSGLIRPSVRMLAINQPKNSAP
jgi:hypothetical protein